MNPFVANHIFVCPVYNWSGDLIVSSRESIVLLLLQKRVLIKYWCGRWTCSASKMSHLWQQKDGLHSLSCVAPTSPAAVCWFQRLAVWLIRWCISSGPLLLHLSCLNLLVSAPFPPQYTLAQTGMLQQLFCSTSWYIWDEYHFKTERSERLKSNKKLFCNLKLSFECLCNVLIGLKNSNLC